MPIAMIYDAFRGFRSARSPARSLSVANVARSRAPPRPRRWSRSPASRASSTPPARSPSATGVPANSSICRSFRLSPIAMTSSRGSPRCSDHARSADLSNSPARDDVDEREVAVLVFRQRDRVLRLGGDLQRDRTARASRAAAGEHHLDRILGQAVLERSDLAQERTVRGEETLWRGCSQSIASKTTWPSRGRSKTTAALARCCGTPRGPPGDLARQQAAASASRRRAS